MHTELSWKAQGYRLPTWKAIKEIGHKRTEGQKAQEQSEPPEPCCLHGS